MADNVAITPGSGATIAADDIGGVLHQRIKIETGADGTATDVSAANPMPVMGGLVTVAVEMTRPANTTAYTPGDVVSDSTGGTTLFDLANLVRTNGASAYITRVALYTDKKSIVPQFRVHLFNASNPTVSVDNAAMRLLYADTGKYLGSVDIPAMTTGTDTANSTMSYAANSAVRLPIIAGGATRSVYALLEVITVGFNPASGQKFTLVVTADQN
jgi:hypothetical protein